jgi:hypothetical protein
MAKKTFQGRPILAGDLKGKALLSKLPFNLTGSFLKNMFGGETKTAPCTDSANKDLYEKDLKVPSSARLRPSAPPWAPGPL